MRISVDLPTLATSLSVEFALLLEANRAFLLGLRGLQVISHSEISYEISGEAVAGMRLPPTAIIQCDTLKDSL